MLPTLEELERSAQIVYQSMPPTPQYRWPRLSQSLGVDVCLKHENHTPLGAFKVRGGLVFFEALARDGDSCPGVVCATRGNHGQSVAFAAAKYSIPSTIVVPEGNSATKNLAMQALGADLVVHGADFQESLEHAERLAEQRGLRIVPSFHPLLVSGVGTYCLELFRAEPELDVLYVPIGLGSGICGALAAKKALGLDIEIVGVVSSQAPAYRESFQQGRVVPHEVTTRIADGMACRKPVDSALAEILVGVSRITDVSDDQVEQAMRDLFDCTGNVAEGAGAAAVAAVAKDSVQWQDKRVAAVLCGGNVDRSVFSKVLAKST